MSKLRTEVQIRTEVEFETAVKRAQLSDLEAQVLRMRAGWTVPADAPLERRGDAHPETRAWLAMVEQRAIECSADHDDLARKQDIIARLRDL